ncbi:tetratricopeptide repeat protein [Siphonobacter sp. SORGH_AS_1065]|uniref:tetratricopeptide repeat protein n=1 Tax=Siphonobacter sp. SORGH_AS_1065 TaxID=3041795 RepID=UPI0027838500|nr:tetratricopeptide repeat protein [Siphonobacter sp. SORGH_AS_1065]MDQ1090041.1 tetratricopeptide (TPR) repeat protein [Siphonobacter sp. SORGH_AS_1065]
MESSQLNKARLLMNLNRASEAIQELKQWLVLYPEDIEALSLLIQAYISTDQHKAALETAEDMLGMIPDYSLSHYFYGVTLMLNKRYKEAEESLLQAIEMDPWDADYFSMLGALHNLQKNWEKGLFYADQGLAVDPEHVRCLNTRTEALTKLGRLEELQSTIEDTLAADPHNAYTQANVGWSKLERGNVHEARQHFAESLRINPTYEYAQGGMKEAVKAKNPIYRAYLGYLFWMNRHQSSVQWTIIIGFMIGQNMIRQYAERYPILNVALVLMILFMYLTWVMMPIGYLILQLDSYGRLALEKRQKWVGIITGVALLIGTLTLGVYYLIPFFIPVDSSSPAAYYLGQYSHYYELLFILGLYSLLVIIPLSRVITDAEELPTWFKVVSWGIIGLGTLAVIAGFFYIGLGYMFGTWALLGVVLYGWVYNFVAFRKK